jgi:hypothetical protein
MKTWQGEPLPAPIEFLCHHLVGLTWFQGEVGPNGEFSGRPKWQAASAFLVEVADHIYLITAGHIFSDTEFEQRANPKFVIKDTLIWDAWSPLADVNTTIPFDFFDKDLAPRVSIYDKEKGIDIAVLQVN